MKQVNFPVTKAQKDFEDLAKTLLSVMALPHTPNTYEKAAAYAGTLYR